MSVKVKMMPNSMATLRIGRSIGSVISNRVRQKPAAATAADSGMARGVAVQAASRMTVENGSRRQVWTTITEIIARVGWPSHIGLSNGFTPWGAKKTPRLTGLIEA